MGMFDKIKGRLGKGNDSTQPSDESFDLDDDALFAEDSLGGDPVGTDDFGAFDSGGDDLDAFDSGGGSDSGGDMGAFESGSGFDTGDDGGFGTFEGDDDGDLGAAQTADFDDLGDLGAAPDDFGDDFEDEAEDTGKKGKKAKKKKAKRGGAKGGGKVVLVTIVAAVAGLAIGFGVGIPVGGIISGNAAKEEQLFSKIEELDAVKKKLTPLKNTMPLPEIEKWRAELEERRGYAREVTEAEALVADQAEQEKARDESQQLLAVAEERLAVRAAELQNIEKQAGQIEARVAYLEQRGKSMQQAAAEADAKVRRIQANLPDEYSGAATVEATRVLNVRGLGSGSASE